MVSPQPLARVATESPVPAAPGQRCWSDSGVYGNRSCAKLAELVHCRNCPVFATAALSLFEQLPPPDYRQQWAAQVAEKQPREPRPTSAILFRIQDEWFALPTQTFQEVTERRPIHSLPHRRQGIVLGLVNVRGELLIAVSLGHFLGLEKLPAPEELRTTYPRLLVSQWEGQRLAFPIDEVHGPHRYAAQELKAAPATLAQSAHSYSQAVLPWQTRIVGCLEPGLLFSALNRSLA